MTNELQEKYDRLEKHYYETVGKHGQEIGEYQEMYTKLQGENERLQAERDNAWKLNGNLLRILRDCKELTYKHDPALNIRICDALTNY